MTAIAGVRKAFVNPAFHIFLSWPQVDEVTARRDEEQEHKDRLTRVQRAQLDREARERKEEMRLQAIANR